MQNTFLHTFINKYTNFSINCCFLFFLYYVCFTFPVIKRIPAVKINKYCYFFHPLCSIYMLFLAIASPLLYYLTTVWIVLSLLLRLLFLIISSFLICCILKILHGLKKFFLLFHYFIFLWKLYRLSFLFEFLLCLILFCLLNYFASQKAGYKQYNIQKAQKEKI